MPKDEKEEEALNRAYKVGISAGWDHASIWLFDEATKAFQLRNDDMARILRQYADIAKKRSAEEHPGIPKKSA